MAPTSDGLFWWIIVSGKCDAKILLHNPKFHSWSPTAVANPGFQLAVDSTIHSMLTTFTGHILTSGVCMGMCIKTRTRNSRLQELRSGRWTARPQKVTRYQWPGGCWSPSITYSLSWSDSRQQAHIIAIPDNTQIQVHAIHTNVRHHIHYRVTTIIISLYWDRVGWRLFQLDSYDVNYICAHAQEEKGGPLVQLYLPCSPPQFSGQIKNCGVLSHVSLVYKMVEGPSIDELIMKGALSLGYSNLKQE